MINILISYYFLKINLFLLGEGWWIIRIRFNQRNRFITTEMWPCTLHQNDTLGIWKMWFESYWFVLRCCCLWEWNLSTSAILSSDKYTLNQTRLLDSVPPTAISHFKQSAEKLIEEKGAVEALAAALAHISGATSVDQRSLINSEAVSPCRISDAL